MRAFLHELEGKNRSSTTLRAYGADLSQFITWLHGNNVVATSANRIERTDVAEYLSCLSQQGLTGVSRARKLAAIREFFRFLQEEGAIERSPATSVATPKKERRNRTYLRVDEYSRMLSLAGGSSRDYAILQVFLQTGIRVSELCNLLVGEVDVYERVLRVRAGKGMAAREIELERKGASRRFGAGSRFGLTAPAITYSSIATVNRSVSAVSASSLSGIEFSQASPRRSGVTA